MSEYSLFRIEVFSILAAIAIVAFRTQKTRPSRIVLAFLITFCISSTIIASTRLFPPPPKPTCENISCIGCDCPEGFCKCVPGGKSCPACKHLRSHEEEHAAHQARLLEQAKRAKQ